MKIIQLVLQEKSVRNSGGFDIESIIWKLHTTSVLTKGSGEYFSIQLESTSETFPMQNSLQKNYAFNFWKIWTGDRHRSKIGAKLGILGLSTLWPAERNDWLFDGLLFRKVSACYWKLMEDIKPLSIERNLILGMNHFWRPFFNYCDYQNSIQGSNQTTMLSIFFKFFFNCVKFSPDTSMEDIEAVTREIQECEQWDNSLLKTFCRSFGQSKFWCKCQSEIFFNWFFPQKCDVFDRHLIEGNHTCSYRETSLRMSTWNEIHRSFLVFRTVRILMHGPGPTVFHGNRFFTSWKHQFIVRWKRSSSYYGKTKWLKIEIFQNQWHFLWDTGLSMFWHKGKTKTKNFSMNYSCILRRLSMETYMKEKTSFCRGKMSRRF